MGKEKAFGFPIRNTEFVCGKGPSCFFLLFSLLKFKAKMKSADSEREHVE